MYRTIATPNIVLHHLGQTPTLTYCGGEPFVIFSYKTGRPNFSANLRAHKVSHLARCRTGQRTC